MTRSTRWFFPLLAILPAMMVAVVVLAYSSYRASSQLAEKTAFSVERSNRVIGQKLIDRIEKVVIDTDRAFFRLVRLDDPQEFRELWRRIVRVSPAVESVIVLDQRGELVHLVATLDAKKLTGFQKVFETRVLPDMALDKLPLDSHKHLHKTYDGKPFLLSYIRQRSAGRDYYIALSINVDHLLQTVFPREFGKLEETNTIAVLDERGRVIYGASRDERLAFRAGFPTTLYKWQLQIEPRQMAALSQEVRARSMTDLILVLGAVAVIFFGMIVLMFAIQRERRANALKSEFIANVSHELKTPLSLIRMFGELLSLGRVRDAGTAQEYAEIITRESDRLTGLIDNVLDFARIERGKAAYEMREGDLAAVVDRTLELCSHRVEQAGVTLERDIEPVTATFDESALTLLLLNLVENALKYGAASGQQVRVRLFVEGGTVRLQVSDDGPGVSPDEQRRVFERFYRGRVALEGSQRGSGIGLALVSHIAEAHGGEALVVSELGKGATFEVRLPLGSEA
jgi:two-component system phosphate regulon sensor histidine kinase PhoR